MQGYIHQLESFGSVDGPGVRFIIFFSGCPLRCKYCHNPDTWDMAKGKLYTADELLNEALSCKAYWGAKGGITVSGGEPLMQLDFLLELFTKAKEKGVNTCIDTAGGPFTKEGDWFEKFKKLMEVTDILLMDIKHMDSEKHREFTTVPNGQILENAKKLSTRANRLVIRVPVIPGFNDTPQELHDIAEFAVSTLGVGEMHILPYHRLGYDKYVGLGRDYPMGDVKPPDKAKMEYLRNVCASTGITCHIGG